jgi:hypothetical protein
MSGLLKPQIAKAEAVSSIIGEERSTITSAQTQRDTRDIAGLF